MKPIKIEVTDYEKMAIVYALRAYNTVISVRLAEKINSQDPTDDGPEVAILQESWDQ